MQSLLRIGKEKPSLLAFRKFSIAHSSVAVERSRYIAIRRFFSQQQPTVPNASCSLPPRSRDLRIQSFYRPFASQTTNENPSGSSSGTVSEDSSNLPPPNDTKGSGDKGPRHDANNYPRYIRRLAASLPRPPHLHRPTRDELLSLTTNFWDRIRIRFRWLTIRGFRKWNADDVSAFLSWFLVGNALWIFIGTTTFVSVIFAILNSLSLQKTVAQLLSNYLTSETGIRIIFESAIVPRWKDSRIMFQNVYVSRRPGSSQLVASQSEGYREAARLLSIGEHSPDAYQDHAHDDNVKESSTLLELPSVADPPEDVVYFDLNIDSVTITLSLWRWWNGKGIITDAEVKGVRGAVDRRHLTAPTPLNLNPASTRYTAQPGDFQLEGLKLEDILVTIYQPGFRPFTASVFTADLSHFRKQWLFYDLLSADNMVGQFDNCLFSVHRPQSINRTMGGDSKDTTWKRMSRFRIDGVNIDHVQYMTGTYGPIAWITSGKLDAVVDISFGRDPAEDIDIHALLGEIAANLSAAATGTGSPDPTKGDDLASLPTTQSPMPDRIPGQRELARPALTAPSEDAEEFQTPSQVVIDMDLRFRDLKAGVPIFTNDISYVNNALIRPIVAFINSNRTLVPIKCRIVKDLKEFDGSWTIWQTGLSDDVANKTYDALAHHVANANQRRLKTVSLWSLRMTASAISSALKNIVDSHSPKRYELA